MSRRSLFTKSLFATLGIALAASTASAQKVVVSHDEWVTQTGYFNANEQQFVSNALSWFGAGSGSSALIYSNNGYITNAGFTNYLNGLGISHTTNAGAASFAGYNVVFVEGNATMNSAALAAYVQGGGNVMYIGGTGIGGAAAEAAYSNPFLNAFGFSFASVYNNVNNVNVNTSGFAAQGPFGAALFTNVPAIYADNGNNISLTAPVAGVTSQLFSDANQNGVFGAAVYSNGVTVTPEPGSFLLVGAGLLAAIPLARRRRKN